MQLGGRATKGNQGTGGEQIEHGNGGGFRELSAAWGCKTLKERNGRVGDRREHGENWRWGASWCMGQQEY